MKKVLCKVLLKGDLIVTQKEYDKHEFPFDK